MKEHHYLVVGKGRRFRGWGFKFKIYWTRKSKRIELLQIRGLDVGRAGNNIRDALLQRICISMPKCFHQIILSGRKFLIGRWSKFTKTITPTKHLSFEFIVNQSSNWIESISKMLQQCHTDLWDRWPVHHFFEKKIKLRNS